MAENWLADVRKYVADADDKVVGAIVRYCGVSLNNRDSSLVAFSDKKETDRVRQNYLKKKLGLTHDNATLDAGIAAVGARMKADRTKNRVTVYYLLADHFGGLGIFGGATSGGAKAGAVGGGASLAAMAPAASAAVPPRPLTARERSNVGKDTYAVGLGSGVMLIGGVIAALLLAKALDRPSAPPAPIPAVAVPAASPAVPAPVAVPDGAGVVAGERDAKPMLTVYFDTGKSAVTPDFTAAAAPVLAHLKSNPGASLAISGFNDPTGNAAANAELSKKRAQGVKSALEALGVTADKAILEKPADTNSAGMTNSEARRVEVVVKG